MTTATAACCDHITKEQALSEQEAIRLNIMRLVNEVTNNGATLVQKYQDFINGEYPDAKPYIIHAAMRDLSVMGGHLPEDTPGSAARIVRVADDEDTPKPKPKKPTMKELTNWDMGRLIRLESDNGRKLILDLWDMMNPPAFFKSANPDEWKYQKATQIKSHHEFRAMQEIVKRGHGCQNPYAYAQTSAAEERRLHEWLSHETREIDNDGLDVVTYLFQVIRNPKETAGGEIITNPYTQSQRLWSIKHLLWRGVDIPWEHITHEDIENYHRGRYEVKRKEAERRLSDPRSRLTPEQEADIRAMLDEMQRAADEVDRRAAAKAMKKAKKAAKKAAAAKADAHDYNSAANRQSANDTTASGNNAASADKGNGNSAANNAANSNNAGNGNSANNNAANGNNAASADKDNGNSAVASGNNNAANRNNADKDNGKNTGDNAAAPTGAFATSLPDPADRGAQAVANAIERYPNVDLDTALENHYSTAGIPKENLSYGQIYDAIIAEANFQKRQTIMQSRMRAAVPNAGAEDNDPPKTRSP